MTVFRAGSASDIGRVRSENQDLALTEARLFAVADGMGGHHGGEIAARLAVDGVRERFDRESVAALVTAMQAANEAVVQRARDEPELQGMGTTMTALAGVLADGTERIAVANVGDSRAYLLQDDRLRQITKDHSLVAVLVEQGTLSPAEAERHPQRNIVTRALGIDDRVLVDSFELVPVTGDRYLICSDGLVDEVAEDVIAGVLRATPDPGEAAEALVAQANEAGGRDNVTCVVVDVVEGTISPEAAPAERLVDVTTGQHRVLADAESLSRHEVEEPGLAGAAGDVPSGSTESAVGEEADSLPGRSPPADDTREPRCRGRRRVRGRARGGGDRPRPGGSRRRVVPVRGPRARAPAPVDVARRVVRRGRRGVAPPRALRGVVLGSQHVLRRHRGEEVAIYRGRPGGVLWIDPTVEDLTGLEVDDLPERLVAELENGKDEDSLSSAREYVEFLEEEAGVEDDDELSDDPPRDTTTTPSDDEPADTTDVDRE
ncbi:MAG: Stp1/IreP family PP2C-type Ser/Thr phosphatase [Acidimicrobiia bacterium]|nr:Stp1/IreP family PP2C-type Ser/Thr phosphatase [Acidimicrobiia bacterium]